MDTTKTDTSKLKPGLVRSAPEATPVEKKAKPTVEQEEPLEEVTLKAPHEDGGVSYKAGDTIRLRKSDAEYVRKAQGIK